MNSHSSADLFQPASSATRPSRAAMTTPILIGGAILAALAGTALVNHRLAKKAERDNPPLGQFVQVDGVRLHYLERGKGPVLVLLHGNGGMIQDFLSSGLLELAAERHRVIVFDRPGYGYSNRPRGTIWGPAAQAALIGSALAQLGITKAVVLGHSWGAAVAVALADREPDLVGGLVLASGYHYPSVRMDVAGATPSAIPLVGDVLRHTVSPLLSRLLWPLMMRKIFGPGPVPAKFAAFPKEMALRPSQLRASAEESAYMIPSAFAAQSRYADLKMPVAIIVGEKDRLLSASAQSGRLHEEISQSSFECVPAVGHMVHHMAPEAVLAAVERVSGAAEPAGSELRPAA